VVIAIIGVLIALLLPAVQSAREAGRRTSCSNNLKQLGLALQSYHSALGVLPKGVTSDKRGEPWPRISWIARILPHLEQDNLWKDTMAAYKVEPVPYLAPPHVGFATPLSVLACPSDLRVGSAHYTHKGRYVALTSYVGVLGQSYDNFDGVLYLDSRTRLTDVRDGTAYTLAAGERPPSADLWYGWWYASYGQAGTGSGDMLLGVQEKNAGGPYVADCPPGPYSFGPGRFDNQCDLFHFYSPHPGNGANFLFCDGSVNFLNYAGASLLPALASRAGGEPADAGW